MDGSAVVGNPAGSRPSSPTSIKCQCLKQLHAINLAGSNPRDLSFLMLDEILQIQCPEQALSNHTGDFLRIFSTGVVKRNGFSQRVHHDSAVLALGEVSLQLQTELLVQVPVYVIGQVSEQ